MVGGQVCTQSGKIVVNLSCIKSMETRVIEQMGDKMAQIMLAKMGVTPATHITIQGTPVAAPVNELEEDEVHAEMVKEEDGDI